MLNHEEISFCKNKLQSRQSELIDQIKRSDGLIEAAQEMTGELSSYDNHPAEQGTELFERGKDVALNEHAEKELEKINESLHAIEEGTYGICITCGKRIPFERLKIIPTADHCVDHENNSYLSRDTFEDTTKMNSQLNSNGTNIQNERKINFNHEDLWQVLNDDEVSEEDNALDHVRQISKNSEENLEISTEYEEELIADIHGQKINPIGYRNLEEDS